VAAAAGAAASTAGGGSIGAGAAAAAEALAAEADGADSAAGSGEAVPVEGAGACEGAAGSTAEAVAGEAMLVEGAGAAEKPADSAVVAATGDGAAWTTSGVLFPGDAAAGAAIAEGAAADRGPVLAEPLGSRRAMLRRTSLWFGSTPANGSRAVVSPAPTVAVGAGAGVLRVTGMAAPAATADVVPVPGLAPESASAQPINAAVTALASSACRTAPGAWIAALGASGCATDRTSDLTPFARCDFRGRIVVSSAVRDASRSVASGCPGRSLKNAVNYGYPRERSNQPAEGGADGRARFAAAGRWRGWPTAWRSA
jgi:hypothetical protein